MSKPVVPRIINPEDPALDNLSLFRYIFQESSLTSTQKLIMLAIFHHRNNKRLECFPGLATLEQETGLNRRTLQRQIALLEEKEFLIKVQEKDGSTIYRTFYFAVWDMEEAKKLYDDDESIFSRMGCTDEFSEAYSKYCDLVPF